MITLELFIIHSRARIIATPCLVTLRVSSGVCDQENFRLRTIAGVLLREKSNTEKIARAISSTPLDAACLADESRCSCLRYFLEIANMQLGRAHSSRKALLSGNHASRKDLLQPEEPEGRAITVERGQSRKGNLSLADRGSSRRLLTTSFNFEESSDEEGGEEDSKSDEQLNNLNLKPFVSNKQQKRQESEENVWLCTLCTKTNGEFSDVCVVCKRPKGYLPSTMTLPFHPPCKTVAGASKFLDQRQIAALLEAGVDPDCADSEGWTGIHWATALGRLDLLELYLSHGGNINKPRADGYTALHITCEIGDEEATLFLVQRGAKTELRTRYDEFTPLHVACREGHNRCVEALGLAGADLNSTCPISGFSPLMVAAIAGHEDCVVSLLLVSNDTMRQCQNLEPLNIHLRDRDGFAAIDLAVLRAHHHVVERLQVQLAKSSLPLLKM